MKKIFVLSLLLLFIVPSFVFASFLQVGPTYTIETPLNLESEEILKFDELEFDQYKLGLDVRMNFWYLQLKAGAKANFTEELLLSSFDLDASASVRVRLLFLDLFFGAGLGATCTEDENSWLINGYSYDKWDDILNSSMISYRVGAAINMGKVSLTLDTSLPLNQRVKDLSVNQNKSVLESLTPDLTKTKTTVGLLFNLF